MNEPIAVTAWSVVSPLGYGTAEFTAGLRSGRSTARPPDAQRSPTAEATACLVPDFDVRERLGSKRVRVMNRVTGLAVTTAMDLLAQLAAGSAVDDTGEQTAVVLGTTNGSVESTMGLTRASLVGERPDHIEPALVPYCVMNCAASQVAIWHQIKGPNATIAAGRNTAAHALNYARRLLVTGRARRVLCGAAEEFSEQRAEVERCARDGAPAQLPLGEGCVLVALEPLSAVTARGERPLATLLGTGSGIGAREDIRATTVRTVRDLLARTGVLANAISVAYAGSDDPDQAEALTELLGAEATSSRNTLSELIGDTASVGGMFAVAALLASATYDPHVAQAPALVATCDDDGAVGAVLLVPHATAAAASAWPVGA